MKWIKLLGLLGVLTIGCAKARPMAPGETRLVLTKNRSILLGGGLVLFTGRIVGTQDVLDWACPEVRWVWRDGTSDYWAESCSEEVAWKFPRSFPKPHVYKTCGMYEPMLIVAAGLGKNRKVRSATTQIEVKCLR